MILIKAFIGLFVIFILPQFFIKKKYPKMPESLNVLYGLIFSLTFTWLLAIIFYSMSIPNTYIQNIFYLLFFIGLILITKLKINLKPIIIYLLTIVILLPLLNHIGEGFRALDAASSWNRWAIELFFNKYHPIDAAYPILMPMLWSLIYKIQGNFDIWWTSQLTLFIIPIFLYAVLFFLYKELKDIVYILVGIFLYPYILMPQAINGNMDMPVMIMGMFSLISLYTASQYKTSRYFEYYTYASLLFAGLASITKQAGLAFIVFDIVYIILNLKFYKNKKLILIFISITILYFLSFLAIFIPNSHSSLTHNIDHLKHLSYISNNKNVFNIYIEKLFYKFFEVPAILPIFKPILNFFKINFISPYLIIFGYIIFIVNIIRKKSSIINILLGIFFIIGVLVWIKFFSYDFRNSLWVRAFFILFFAINLKIFFKKYKPNSLLIKFILFIFMAIFGYKLYTLGDKYAYNIQNIGQKQVCLNPSLAKYAASLLQNKRCAKIYTNELALPFNYYVWKYQKEGKFVQMGWDYKYYNFKFLEHNCTEGGYIIFRKTSLYMPEWWKVQKLEKDKKIKKIKPLIYFVPPNIKIPKDYFDRNSKIVDINLTKSFNDIKFSIDRFTLNKNYIYISGWAFIKNNPLIDSEKYIILTNKSNSKYYIFNVENVKRNDVAKAFKNEKLTKSGFSAIIPLKYLYKGNYKIELLLIDKNSKQHRVIFKQSTNILK